MITTRRNFLLASTALLGLTGCKGSSISGSISTVAGDVADLGKAFAGAIPAALNGLVDAPTLSKVNSWIGTINNVAGQLTALPSGSNTVSLGKQIEDAVNGVLAVAAPLLAAVPTVGPILSAAAVLLPVIETGLGMIVNIAPKAGGMSVAQARLVLRAAAAR